MSGVCRSLATISFHIPHTSYLALQGIPKDICEERNTIPHATKKFLPSRSSCFLGFHKLWGVWGSLGSRIYPSLFGLPRVVGFWRGSMDPCKGLGRVCRSLGNGICLLCFPIFAYPQITFRYPANINPAIIYPPTIYPATVYPATVYPATVYTAILYSTIMNLVSIYSDGFYSDIIHPALIFAAINYQLIYSFIICWFSLSIF